MSMNKKSTEFIRFYLTCSLSLYLEDDVIYCLMWHALSKFVNNEAIIASKFTSTNSISEGEFSCNDAIHAKYFIIIMNFNYFTVEF